MLTAVVRRTSDWKFRAVCRWDTVTKNTSVPRLVLDHFADFYGQDVHRKWLGDYLHA